MGALNLNAQQHWGGDEGGKEKMRGREDSGNMIKKKVSEDRLRRSAEGGLHRGRKEGCCKGKENSFPSNPQGDSLRCQKNVSWL